jgi:hypothetical protein
MPDNGRAMVVASVSTEDLPAAREAAAEHQVEIREMPATGIDPVSAVALLLIGSALGVAMVQRAIDARRGGQVIDLRAGATRNFYRDREVVYGLVVVLGADGSVTVEVKEPDGNFREIIDAVAKLTASLAEISIEAIAKILRVNLPAGATVTERPGQHQLPPSRTEVTSSASDDGADEPGSDDE